MSEIGIIANPHSKLNKRDPGRQALLGYIIGEKGHIEVTNTLRDLERVALDFKRRGVKTLAINGGDGTISRTLTAFIGAYGDDPLPRIALLRGGTINVLANNIGVKGKPEGILYRLAETYGNSDPVPTVLLRTIQVEGNYGFLFGNGISALFLREYYKRKSGPIGAALWVGRVWLSRFVGSKLYSTVVQDSVQTLIPDTGAHVRHRTCAVFCATIKKLPLGYPLFFATGSGAQSFQTVSFTFGAKNAVWRIPWSLIQRQNRSDNNITTFNCKTLQISTDDQKTLYVGRRNLRAHWTDDRYPAGAGFGICDSLGKSTRILVN